MKAKLRPIKIIHLFISAGIILLYIVMGDLLSSANWQLPYISQSSIIYLLIPVAAIFLSNFLYNYQIKNASNLLTLDEKIGLYQIASIIRLAVLEGAALMILFLKPGFVLFGILLILYILFLRPTETQFANDVEHPRL